MPRHSKNCTASSFFTYEERRRLQHGTITQRLGADSIKSFDTCCICLKQVNDGVACTQAHIFCRSCILESLLLQNQDLKRAQRAYQLEQARDKNEVESSEQMKKNDEVSAFQEAEAGIQYSQQSSKTRHRDESIDEEYYDDDGRDGPKRHRALSSTSSTSYDPNLRAYWVPSLAPDQRQKAKIAKPSKHCVCPEGKHPLRLKELRAVKFEAIESDDNVSTRHTFICPCCRKTLTNSSRIMWLSACGHIVCALCYDTLVITEKSCVKCGHALSKKHSVIQLHVGGTGFSAHGAQNMAKMVTPAFQG